MLSTSRYREVKRHSEAALTMAAVQTVAAHLQPPTAATRSWAPMGGPMLLRSLAMQMPVLGGSS